MLLCVVLAVLLVICAYELGYLLLAFCCCVTVFVLGLLCWLLLLIVVAGLVWLGWLPGFFCLGCC